MPDLSNTSLRKRAQQRKLHKIKQEAMMKRRTFPAGLGVTGVGATTMSLGIVRAAGDTATVEAKDAFPPLANCACPMVIARK
jgi:hypothetical protein